MEVTAQKFSKLNYQLIKARREDDKWTLLFFTSRPSQIFFAVKVFFSQVISTFGNFILTIVFNFSDDEKKIDNREMKLRKCFWWEKTLQYVPLSGSDILSAFWFATDKRQLSEDPLSILELQ